MFVCVCLWGPGKQKCFMCKAVSHDPTISCVEKSCGQLYHVKCVEKLLPADEPVDNKTFICPLHRCATCQAIGKTVFAGSLHLTFVDGIGSPTLSWKRVIKS